MNLPDWLMIKVLPIAIIVLAELWWILRLRKDRKRLKDELEKERKEHNQFKKFMLRHRD